MIMENGSIHFCAYHHVYAITISMAVKFHGYANTRNNVPSRSFIVSYLLIMGMYFMMQQYFPEVDHHISMK